MMTPSGLSIGTILKTNRSRRAAAIWEDPEITINVIKTFFFYFSSHIKTEKYLLSWLYQFQINARVGVFVYQETPLGPVKVVCGMLQRRLSRVASDDNPTRALATGGDWTIGTYFRFRAQHRMWNTNNQNLVESDENESKENFHSSPEDVKNFKLNTLNAKWLYLTIFTNWRYVLSAVFL